MFVTWSDDNDPRNDNFHLQPASPCVDVISSGAKDADGGDRDLGAYGGQGSDGGPRATCAVVGEVDTTEVDPAAAVSIQLAALPNMLPCDHGVDRLELTLPGFLSGLQVTNVVVNGNAVTYQLSGTTPVVIELAEVVGEPETISVTLEGTIPADATASETIGLRAGMAFINAWTDGEAGDGDGGGVITTASLTITATTGGGTGGGGAGGTGSGGSGEGAASSGTGGSTSGGPSGDGDDPSTDSSCGCRLVGLTHRATSHGPTGRGALGLALLGMFARRRRRQRDG